MATVTAAERFDQSLREIAARRDRARAATRAATMAEIARLEAEIARLEDMLDSGDRAEAMLARANQRAPAQDRGVEKDGESRSHFTQGVTCGNAGEGASSAPSIPVPIPAQLHPAAPSTAPSAPPPYLLAAIRAVVDAEGGRFAATASEWAVRLRIETSAAIGDMPGSRELSFGRWRLPSITAEVWATTGLTMRRKTIHGRRLIEITAQRN